MHAYWQPQASQVCTTLHQLFKHQLPTLHVLKGPWLPLTLSDSFRSMRRQSQSKQNSFSKCMLDSQLRGLSLTMCTSAWDTTSTWLPSCMRSSTSSRICQSSFKPAEQACSARYPGSEALLGSAARHNVCLPRASHCGTESSHSTIRAACPAYDTGHCTQPDREAEACRSRNACILHRATSSSAVLTWK